MFWKSRVERSPPHSGHRLALELLVATEAEVEHPLRLVLELGDLADGVLAEALVDLELGCFLVVETELVGQRAQLPLLALGRFDSFNLCNH